MNDQLSMKGFVDREAKEQAKSCKKTAPRVGGRRNNNLIDFGGGSQERGLVGPV